MAIKIQSQWMQQDADGRSSSDPTKTGTRLSPESILLYMCQKCNTDKKKNINFKDSNYTITDGFL